ncbi:MAG: SiaB family protein kinase [Campylobacterota bacterium]|nr:SiaB family protein kinase [Campylobacterota bacterium]
MLNILIIENDISIIDKIVSSVGSVINNINIVTKDSFNLYEIEQSIKEFDILISNFQISKAVREIDEFISIFLIIKDDNSNILLDAIKINIDGYIKTPIDDLSFFTNKLKLKNEAKKRESFRTNKLYNVLNNNIIFSKTNLDGVITEVSDAFCNITGYTKDELIGNTHSILRDTGIPDEIFMYMWSVLSMQDSWKGELKNRKKDGSSYWVSIEISPSFNYKGELIGYESISKDIALQKEIEILNTSLELTINKRTNELKIEKENAQQVLSNILFPILITSRLRRVIVYANQFALDLYDINEKEYINRPLDEIYTLKGGVQDVIDEITQTGRVDSLEKVVTTHSNKTFTALLSVIPISYNNEDCYIGMTIDISKQKQMENQVRDIYNHTRESIEYASLIQGAVLPEKDILSKYFKDSFVYWMPKDTVGGDIWLFNDLRHKDECLLLFIDCTGHGVPGAFVTMIVKAIEKEIILKIKSDRYYDIDVSPAWIMKYFNKSMKTLLKQESRDSKSNVGWDGGIIYYNRRTQILKFAGAETPLFYTDIDNKLNLIKGNRYSVGYKKCDENYKYKETVLEVEEGMKFYCTTDGYLDQNGGEKDFPFGKKRFQNIIKNNHIKNMNFQKRMFLKNMKEYESMVENNDRNDDMTVIAFEIDEKSKHIEIIREEIIKYEGVMSQNVVGASMDNIETKIDNMAIQGVISTITIECCQNMMNYSKNKELDSREIVPAGFIEVQNINNQYYEVTATNIVSIEDKEKIEPKLVDIKSMDKAAIKKRYRELRKSGKNTHQKGGGIGFYEISKISDSIEYSFKNINKEKFYFTLKSVVKQKEKKANIVE